MLLTLSLSCYADNQSEINHLLAYVKSTNCQYERNGKVYSGAQAIEHINKKYQYFLDDINTAEDFIKYAATKSKMSGRYYLVHCSGQPVTKSKDWLLKELIEYRNQKSK